MNRDLRSFGFRSLAGALAAAMLLLTACDNDKDVDPPAQLVDLKPKIEVRKLWSTGLGGDEHMRMGLRPATDLTKLYAAGTGGEVHAFDLDKGTQLWRVQTKLHLSGGPGVGAGMVAVGSSEGDIVVLNAADGTERWRTRVSGEVLAAPAISETAVVVRTVDGRLHGLNPADGKDLWLNEQNVPRLSLRGTAPPVIVSDAVLCGFDNGKVVSVNIADGSVLWETPVAPSRGRTELERLVDIDSAVQVIGKDVFVVGFQGRAAMLALESGQIWWSRDVSSERGLAVGNDLIYIANANGDLTALKRRDGASVWEQKALHRRGLSGPALDGPTVVVADYQGYVHWLDAATGELLARVKTDGKRVSNAPLVVDDKVFVQTDGGQLSAFKRMGGEAAAAAKSE